MSINKKFLVVAVAGLTLGASSCKKYLDVNTNPNVAQSANVQTLLPAAQLLVGSAVGVDLQVNGSIWAQFWTQSPSGKEYIPFEQFAPKADAFSGSWGNLYAGASNFYQLAKISDDQHKDQYKAISLLMQAYTFQVLTDAWGDVPFTEALKGQYPDGNVVSPKYDSQRVIYRGIVSYIDSATKLMNTGNATRPGSDDLIYGGDMQKWKKFANTLKLRVLLRMSKADPVYAQLKMDTLYSTNPQFLGEGDDAHIAYGATAGSNNPLYAELSSMQLAGTQQLAGSKTCIDSMNSNNDYRGVVFYKEVNAMGLIGIKQGEYDITLPSGSYSIPNSYVGADATNKNSAMAAVNLLSAAESYFLQAEAIAKGMTTGDDAMMFYAGIHASYMYYGNAITTQAGATPNAAYDMYINGDIATATPAGYWVKYPATGTADEKTRHIITQKWFAMCGNQGFEAWTEWRRTGYPDFLISPRNSLIGTAFPLRFIYPATEVANNAKFPGTQPIVLNVWWDKL
jgi:hypothetical protein